MLLQYEDCNFPRLLTCKRRNEEVSSRCIHWSNLPPLTLKLPGYYWTQKGGKKRPPLLLYKAPTLSWERARAEQSHKREIRNYPWILLTKPKAAKASPQIASEAPSKNFRWSSNVLPWRISYVDLSSSTWDGSLFHQQMTRCMLSARMVENLVEEAHSLKEARRLLLSEHPSLTKAIIHLSQQRSKWQQPGRKSMNKMKGKFAFLKVILVEDNLQVLWRAPMAVMKIVCINSPGKTD